jgi:flagellar protein FliS
MPKEELTYTLFDGAVKFLNQAIAAVDCGEKDYLRANELTIRAQNIVRELQVTLDRSYDVARGLADIYAYIYDLIVDANIKKDVEKLREARDLLRELRDVWKEAITSARKDARS